MNGIEVQLETRFLLLRRCDMMSCRTLVLVYKTNRIKVYNLNEAVVEATAVATGVALH